ncbi:MAG TPA: carboxypeptidase-like regulatory domain-containing protein [Bryobacteraceae bacterium]|nr:carboxypeptidase-like regulatory domain-containing protein [Bryobacteraceae bacterium]
MKRSGPAALAVMVVILAGFPALTFGQVSTATVLGTVTDPAGAVVPGAAIALVNLQTGVEIRSLTNDTGNYRIQNIQVGTYSLSVSADGFSTKRVDQLTLTVNQTSTLDFSLALGAVAETVKVEASGVEVQSSTAELGQVVQEKQVVDLPLNGRNFTQMMMLQPGVVTVSPPGSQSLSYTRGIGEATNPSVNGQNNRSNVYMLDGVANFETFGNAWAVPPIIDAIQEFKLQSHNDSAEFGAGSGGTVNVVTKSGTNAIHGTGFYFGKNDAFNARQFNQATVNPFKQHQYGGTVGGPVIRNRTFYFGAYQGFRFRSPARQYFYVPTEAMLNGDFSGPEKRGGDIFDPLTTRQDPVTGAFLRDPFPDNKIPMSRIDQRMLEYLRGTGVPLPVVTDQPRFNALNNRARMLDQEEWQVKVDHNFRANDMVWFRYSSLDQTDSGPGGRTNLVSISEQNSYNMSASWVHIMDPTSTLQVQFGKSISDIPNTVAFENVPSDLIQKVGLGPELVQYRLGTIVSGFSPADYFGGTPIVQPNRPADNWQLKGTWSKIVGSHTLKIGGDFMSATMRRQQASHGVDFTRRETADLARSATTGDAMASMLLNVPNFSTRRNIIESLRFGGNLGLFIQDSWKVNQKLTVNLGLRFDNAWVPQFGTREELNIFSGNANTDTGEYVIFDTPPACSATQRAPCIPTPDGSLPANVRSVNGGTLFDGRGGMFGPRVGIAYRLTNKTALRASGGIFYDTWAGIYQRMRGVGGTWPDVSVTRLGSLNDPTPSRPFPGITGQDPSLGASGLPEPTPFNQEWWFVDPEFDQAYSMQWNFGVQHQLAQATVLEVNYVGSGSRDLSVGGRFNTAVRPGPGDPRERMRFPYMRPTFFEKSIGRSNYNSLQVALRRSYQNGLALTAAYTWSKSIDVACSGFFGAEACSVQDEYNLNNDRSVSAFDVPHNLVVSWVYEMPFGRGKSLTTNSKVIDSIIGGWQFNGIMALRNGIPYHVTVPGDIANVFNSGTYVRAKLVGEHRVDSPTPVRSINTSAFAAPEQFTFGNLGRNSLRPDWVRRFDLSVFRRFPLKAEKVQLELRLETFNAFNTPIFAAPNANLASGTFGLVTGVQVPPRQLQLGGKIIF